jgi:hypothetical protein
MPLPPFNSSARGIPSAAVPTKPSVATLPDLYLTPLVESLAHYLDELPPAGSTKGETDAAAAATGTPAATGFETVKFIPIVKTSDGLLRPTARLEAPVTEPLLSPIPASQAPAISQGVNRQFPSSFGKSRSPKTRGKSYDYYRRRRDMDKKLNILSSLRYQILLNLVNLIRTNRRIGRHALWRIVTGSNTRQLLRSLQKID